MLSNSSPPSRDVDEATVVSVDSIRFLCKVKTQRGQMLSSVRWLVPYGGSGRGGDRFVPSMGDRVMIEHGLGSPVIVGFFPRIQTEDGATPLTIASGDVGIDTGNYSPDGYNAIPDQNKPLDMVGGDRITSSPGGAFLALLRGGSVLLRSSRLSEIFLSKFSSLVRIVSRNWEHFTDVSSDIVRNYKGRVYRYTGYARTFLNAKLEDYRLNYYYGDVPAAEAVKTNYNTYSGNPATDTIFFKEQVLNVNRIEYMTRTLNTVGEEEVWITNGSVFVRINTKGNVFKLSYNDQDYIECNAGHLHLERHDGAIVNLDATGIQASFNGGSVVIDSTSVVTTKGASTVSVTNAYSNLDSNGHFCHVDAAGVQLG